MLIQISIISKILQQMINMIKWTDCERMLLLDGNTV